VTATEAPHTLRRDYTVTGRSTKKISSLFVDINYVDNSAKKVNVKSHLQSAN
jgi:hypothetical protein